MNTRAIRGATCLQRDDATEMAEAVTELLLEVLSRNSIESEDLISVLFTATPDQEIGVVGAMEKVVRVMVQVQTSKSRSEIKHVYLRGAEALRQDIAQ
jgi:chorismate mutase